MLLGVAIGTAMGTEKPATYTDAQVRQRMIQESIRGYSGSCPCPDNVDRAGRRCGARSAYSKPGGASPICYAEQISDESVEAYRNRHKLPKPARKS